VDASVKLAEMQRKGEGEYDKARMVAEMGRVISTVREMVPKDRWPELQAKLRGETLPSASSDEAGQGPESSPVRIVSISDSDDDD
jgi:hypothetical protein